MKIDDIDVFDSIRALLDDGVDLDDRAAVKRGLSRSTMLAPSSAA